MTNMGIFLAGMCLGATIVCATGAATASTITYDIKFSAGNFSVPPISGPSTVQGEFHITLDPALSTGDTASGLIVDSLNIPVDGSVAYRNDLGTTPSLTIGGTDFGICCATSTKHDFSLVIENLTTSPVVRWFIFTDGGSDLHIANTISLQVTIPTLTPPDPPLATTPVSAALPLFVSALGGLGFLGWRRRAAA